MDPFSEILPSILLFSLQGKNHCKRFIKKIFMLRLTRLGSYFVSRASSKCFLPSAARIFSLLSFSSNIAWVAVSLFSLSASFFCTACKVLLVSSSCVNKCWMYSAKQWKLIQFTRLTYYNNNNNHNNNNINNNNNNTNNNNNNDN